MKDMWKTVLTRMKSRIPSHSFRMWIEPLRFAGVEGDRLLLSCPNHFSMRRVEANYASMIADEFGRQAGHGIRLQLNVRKGSPPSKRAAAPAEPAAGAVQLELPAIAAHQPLGRHLRDDWTLDNYVVAGFNDFAYSAALSLAGQTDFHQNCLYLHSDTGMGKSHLSQAVGHHIHRHFPEKRVYYITAEDFTNEMVQSFRHNSLDRFKEKYRRQCDVLLLDDIHFLTGKERTQQELSLSLDHLLNARKKIIFTSSRLPGEIPKLNDQLRSRLCGSLISPIETPDFSARSRILKIKARNAGIQLTRPVMEYLAGELTDNVRQLESGLASLAARSSLTGHPLDLYLAKTVVESMARGKKRVTISFIKDLVCDHYRVTPEEITGRSRKRKIVHPRQMAIYLSRKFTDQPLQTIGKQFNRYHATVIHSIGVIEKGMRTDTVVRRETEYLAQKIESVRRGQS